MQKLKIVGIIPVGILLFVSSCKKVSVTTDALYIPVAADVTATATLAELQQGRTIFVNSCGQCHELYSPDTYSASNWNSILVNMGPRAGLTAAQTTLVSKYVSRGK
jgi:cytochrome c5